MLPNFCFAHIAFTKNKPGNEPAIKFGSTPAENECSSVYRPSIEVHPTTGTERARADPLHGRGWGLFIQTGLIAKGRCSLCLQTVVAATESRARSLCT